MELRVWKEVVAAKSEVSSWWLTEETEENHNKPEAGWLISKLRYEPRISSTCNWRAINLNAIFSMITF
jgi:hypothetical protein